MNGRDLSPERTVVITGAARGLGLASAIALYNAGWRVVCAMRSPEAGLASVAAAAGAAPGDRRLIAVRLDLDDPDGIEAAARDILLAIGAPDALVHNAGIAGAGAAEETPPEVWERMFRTNVIGPIRLTNALLPAMREAGKGRIVAVSSMAAVRGMPSVGAYAASKGALERWAEALAGEINPFGISVSILITGSYQTSIITSETPDYGNHSGPYAELYKGSQQTGKAAVAKASDPSVFAKKLVHVLDSDAPFERHAMGNDARQMIIGARILSARMLHRVVCKAMGLPKFGQLKASGAS